MALIELQHCESKTISPCKHYGKFTIDRLNNGQSLTIGNALRRVLLSEIEGSAIVAARIGGVSHEFSTLPGVKEDVIEILMNLKSIVLSSDSLKTEIGRICVQGPKIVTAADMELAPGVELVDPTQYIANICNETYLDIEFCIEKGRGYRSKGLDSANYATSDFLKIDGVFMPVQKVNFQSEDIQLTAVETKERLTLEVWTDGTIKPDTAVQSAAANLTKVFQSLAGTSPDLELLDSDFSEPIDSFSSTTPFLTGEEIQQPQMLIEELQLSVRAYNCLKRAQINSVEELLTYSEEQLLEIKNFGQKSATEVILALKERLHLTLPKFET